MLGELLRDERLPGRDFKDASAHEIAGIIIGQLQRVITLLNRQHAEQPPIAISQAVTTNTPVNIYTATRKQYIRLMAISASGAGNITLLMQHPTSGPQKWQVFVAQAAGVGALPVGEHEFVMPRDATLWVQADQNITVGITASVFDGEEPEIIMNYEF